MTLQSSTLRPGLLVSLNTRVQGNVRYSKQTIEATRIDSDGAQRAKWETERTVTDPQEHENAAKARSKANALIRGVCALSAFGLLCPDDKARDLESAINEALRVAADFNAGAKLSRLSVYVVCGRIAQDDVQAVRAIRSEISELLSEMEQGVANLDPEEIAKATARARSVSQMLQPDAQERVQGAIDAARKAARAIRKAGETAGQEVDRIALGVVASARVAFLDIEDVAPVATVEAAPAPAIDLAPEPIAPAFDPLKGPAGETIEIAPDGTFTAAPAPVAREIEI
jgi:hypothetical protein